MPRLALVGLALAAALIGCGGRSVLRPQATANTVAQLVAQQTGFHARDVKCPANVDAKVNQTLSCHFTGPEGPYVAELRVLAVHGQRVDFFISTHRGS